MTVFVLQHSHEFDDGTEDVKMIGVYSSRTRAEAAVARLKTVPGFASSPEGFVIDEYELDVDHWRDGFVTL